MENKVIEKCDEEINVEEIMKKIRENICRRQVAGDIYPDQIHQFHSFPWEERHRNESIPPA